MATNFGVDWAGQGWLVASVEDEEPPQVAFHPTIFEVWNRLPADGRMAIDIPIGLSTDGRRPCDREAKTILGVRGNSVFYTPTRGAVYASNIDEAKEEQADLDYSIQNQAWSLVPRIREVDRFLQIHASDIAPGQVIETHPEVEFAALNGGDPVQEAKKDDRGKRDRLDLLQPHLDAVETVFTKATSRFQGPEYVSQLAKPDDVLDALAALVVVKEGGQKPPRLPLAAPANWDDELDRGCVIAYSQEVDWGRAPADQRASTSK